MLSGSQETIGNNDIFELLNSITLQHQHVNAERIAAKKIDPLEMTAEDSYFLGRLLDACCKANKQYFFKQGLNVIELKHPHTGVIHLLHLTLAYPLVWRVSEGRPWEYRFEIFGDVLGTGGFSTVYKSKGVLAPQLDGSLKLKNSNRVIKVQHHHAAYSMAYAFNEYELGKLTPHIHGKKPTIVNNGEYSYLVMRYFTGKELFTLLKADRRNAIFNTEQRLLLSLKILLAIQEQIQIRGIVHKDIKPENIMILIDDDNIEVKIIDLGSSKKNNSDDNLRMPCTPPYAAPERYTKILTSEKSDVFSSGRVLGLLWRASVSNLHVSSGLDSPIDIDKAYQDALHYQFDHIFKGIDDLDPKHQSQIKEILIKMCAADSDARCSFDEAIDVFEKIIDERKARNIARSTLQQLTIAKTKAVEIRKMVSAQSCNPVMMLVKIHKHLEEVSDVPLVITEFVATLRVHALQELSSKAEIVAKLQSIVKSHLNYKDQMNELQGMLKVLIVNNTGDCKLGQLAQRELTFVCDRLVKIDNGMLTLDDMVVANKQLAKVINSVQMRVRFLHGECEKVLGKTIDLDSTFMTGDHQACNQVSLPSRSGLFARKNEREISVQLNGIALQPVISRAPRH